MLTIPGGSGSQGRLDCGDWGPDNRPQRVIKDCKDEQASDRYTIKHSMDPHRFLDLDSKPANEKYGL